MSPEIDIKAYLVSLGYEVDETSYNKFISTLKKVDNIVDKHTSNMTGGFAKAGLAVASAIGGIVISTYEMVESIAKADLGYEKLALRMYMNKDAAKAYSIALKVLGEEPDNIRWMPELHKHYMELMQDAQRLALPKEFNSRIQDFRSMSFEFKRMKQEMTYGVEWIGFSILNHLVDPLGKAKFNLHSLNEYIITNIPRWTDKIGDGISKIMKFFGFLWDIIKRVGTGFGMMWDSMSDPVKILLVVAGIGKILMMLSPLLRVISLVTFAAVEMYDALGGRKTFLPIEAWQTFAGVVDGVARSLMVVMSLLEGAHNFEKTVQGYSRFLLGKASANVFGFKGLDWIPGYKELGEKSNKNAESWLSYGRESWGKVTSVPRDLNAILNPYSKNAITPWYENSNLYMSNNDRESLNQQMQKSGGLDASKLGNVINKASQATGIAPSVIYGQWFGETNNFTNRGAKELNNLAGIRLPGSKEYQKFSSLEEFGSRWTDLITRLYPNAMGAKTPEALASGLHSGIGGRSWYEDSQSNYTEIIRRGMSHYSQAGNISLGSNNSTEVTINVNGISDPKAAADAMIKELEPYINIANREVRDKNQAAAILAGIGNRPSTQGSPMTPVVASK